MSGYGPVLVTGGTGTTGRPLVQRLRDRGAEVRIASRHPTHSDVGEHVYFDWTDPETFPAALAGVKRIYVLPPSFLTAPMTVIEPFLMAAQDGGSRRIVLLSVTGGSSRVMATAEQVHRTVRQTTAEWAILRPTWFMQNFIEGHPFAADVRERGQIITATGDGRIGFIDVRDIAAVAANALLDDPAPNTEYLLTGPETLSYTEVAAIITEISGHQVHHVGLTLEERVASVRAMGLPETAVTGALDVESKVRNGAEDYITTTVHDLTGRPARSFREFVTDHQTAWRASGCG